MRKIIPFLICLAFSANVIAQSGEQNGILYEQFFNNYGFVNPAIVDTLSQLKLAIGNRSLTGIFSGVSRSFADVEHQKIDKLGQIRNLGASFYSLRDGDYFQRNKIYIRYARAIMLDRQTMLSVGLSLGVLSYRFESSPASAGGSDFSVDGNVGVWLHHRSSSFGFSYQQITNPELTPVIQTFVLPAYFNVSYILKKDINENLFFEGHVLLKYLQDNEFYGEVAPLITWKRNIKAGVNYRYERGLSGIVGITKVNFRDYYFNLFGSYRMYSQGIITLMDNVLELNLSFYTKH